MAIPQLYNLVRMSTATTGTGTITLGSTVTGFRSFVGASVPNGATVRYAIADPGDAPTQREWGTGVYNSGTNTLTRVLGGSSTGSLLNLSGSAHVFITATSGDFLPDVRYLPSETGAAERTVSGKLGDCVSVLDFGADPTGVAASDTAFNSAAATGKICVVPAGTYLINSTITTAATWFIWGAIINGLTELYPGAGGGHLSDTTRLTGKVFHFTNKDGYTGFRIGDSDPWLERDIRPYSEAISEAVVLSASGQVALTTGTRTSDNLTANYAGIGHSSYIVNDNTTNPETGWARYTECRRSSGAGSTFGEESDFVNLGDTYDIDPYTTISGTSTGTVNYWTTSGGGDVAWGGQQLSAAWVMHPNPANWKRGWVVQNGALDLTVNEAASWPSGAKLAWYGAATWLKSYIWDRQISLTHNSDTAATGISQVSKRLRANRTDATASLDAIYRHDFYGYSGSAEYACGFFQVLQRSNFSTGHARYSFDIQVNNTDGTTSQISLNGLGNESFAPYPDNLISLGTGSFRWTTVYAATGTINTSDINAKTDVRELNDQERAVAVKCKQLVRAYRLKDSVAQKGDDARIHIGVIAQHVISAFESEGLDPFKYGIVCVDEVDKEAGWSFPTRYGVRYDELAMFIISAL